MKDIFIGATIAVYSRQLKVVDYADEFTAKAYGPKRSRYGRATPSLTRHTNRHTGSTILTITDCVSSLACLGLTKSF